MQSRTGFLMAAAAVMLLVGVTVLQGWWTERWAEREDRALEKAARRLVQSFPETFGNWTLDKQLETSKAELDRAGAVGSISRIYRSTKTKTPVSAFVVCATPHDASGHTPDRCYPGAGFEIAEPEHRETISLADGRIAEAYTGTFAKQGQTLRVYWTYGVPNKKTREAGEAADDGADAGPKAPAPLTWVAPQIARIALNDFPAVYKLYAIVDQTTMTPSRARAECGDFIGQVLPAFEAAAAAEAEQRSAPADESAAEPAAEPAAATAG
ncbi:MAG: exosortase-associated EpsI family protein [Planctomycetaceae bacterium]